MLFPKVRCGLLCVALCVPCALHAQKPTTAATTDENSDNGPNGIIPDVKGFNASLGTSSQHDSSNGWSSFFSPDVAWRFNRNFSVDATTPIYAYINVDENTGTKLKPVYKYAVKKGVVGDTAINGHFETHRKVLDYQITATLGTPTGDPKYGLGAGQVTYLVNNHIEKSLGIFTPDIELGLGDASNLIGTRVVKSYVAVGELAFFQAGTSIDLPFNASFDAEAYEELPIASTTIYSTTGKGKKKVTTATNEGAAEDNGFNSSVDIPVKGHMVVSGFYSRSLRNRIDTAGFSLTFLLRAAPKRSSE